MPATADRLLTLTAQIAAAYVGAKAVDPTAVPGLIRDIQRHCPIWSRTTLVTRRSSGPGDLKPV